MLRRFTNTRSLCFTAVSALLFFSVLSLSAETVSPSLARALKALDRYVKSCDSWDRVDFQDYIAEAAETGDPDAQFQYYHFTFDKHYGGYYWPDIKLSDTLAVEYLKKSAARGNINALGEMGLLMSFGKKEWNIEENRLKAFEYLSVARKANNPKYILELGKMYLERADSIPSSFQDALNCFDEFENIGGNKWDAVIWKFEVFYRTRQFNKAYPLAKQWFREFKKQYKYNRESNYKKIDSKFRYPIGHDFLKAIEVFLQSGNAIDLNLIPIRSNNSYGYYYPDKALNFKVWDDESVYYKYEMLDMIEDYYIHKGVDPNYLKSIQSLKFFYNINTSPDKKHCFSRARYYKYIQDYDNEIRLLYDGVKKEDFTSSLQLALYYYYGTEYISIDKNKSFEILEGLKDWSNYVGYNRIDYAKACYLLGMLYYSNEIKGFDYKKSVEYLNKFLKNGRGTSSNIIGEVYRVLAKCYRYGRGVEIDTSKADEYSSLAVKWGNAEEIEIQKWLKELSDEKDKPKSD